AILKPIRGHSFADFRPDTSVSTQTKLNEVPCDQGGKRSRRFMVFEEGGEEVKVASRPALGTHFSQLTRKHVRSETELSAQFGDSRGPCEIRPGSWRTRAPPTPGRGPPARRGSRNPPARRSATSR